MKLREISANSIFVCFLDFPSVVFNENNKGFVVNNKKQVTLF
jgi:hypothetical protein